MTPESKKLLSQFACALSNETIYGEGDHVNLKRCREYGAKTETARKALEAHIEQLEAQAAPATCQPSGAIGQGPTAEATGSLYVAYGDDDAVDLFAKAMKAKMAASRAKGRSGWHDPDQCSAIRLQTMLVEHLAKGDPVDVANFAMMLWNRGEPVADVGMAFRNGGLEPDWSAYAAAESATPAEPVLMRQAVASVVSRVGDELRVGWLRPERCDVGTLLYCAAEHSRAAIDTEARDDSSN